MTVTQKIERVGRGWEAESRREVLESRRGKERRE